MVINALKKGGRERRMLELIKGLVKHEKQFDVCLLSLSPLVEYPYVYDLPIRFEVIPGNDNQKMSRSFKIRRIIKEFQPDVIHSWDVTSSGYLSIANLFINKPVVQCVIYDASTQSDLAKSIKSRIKLLAPFSKVFVSNSKAGIRAYQPPARKSVCIYNGIDLNRFDNLKSPATVEKELFGSENNNRFVVAMVAAFEIRKDYDTFLQAAITVCRKDPNAAFLLIGNGDMSDEIKAKTPADLLGKQIYFPGMRHDIESILQIVNVGVLATNSANHGEGISNTIVEYMASSKPVIASRGGGTDELVQDNMNGFLIDPKSPDQLVDRIERLRSDTSLAAAMGQQARRWIVENFEVTRMTKEYISLYQRLLDKKPVLEAQPA